ncbi:hypothetical protein [Flammeovirga aprica]|uniref:Uncharacterized protein n=1 Tax=Flammeovirga aprica JL-4 TaxID=694437 RepID=A0A7X9RQW9_9BACT|nr:hypothetical protein [Flammeovirga aprica]NME67203.1 hypothetical protein [Flammeovirga aprica JL-4]
MKTKGSGFKRFKNFFVRNKATFLVGFSIIAGVVGFNQLDIDLGGNVIDRVIPDKVTADTVVIAKGDTLIYNEKGQVTERRKK